MKHYIVSSRKIETIEAYQFSFEKRLEDYLEANLNPYNGFHWEAVWDNRNDEYGISLYVCRDSDGKAVHADYIPIGDDDDESIMEAWEDREEIADMENQYLNEENFTSEDFNMMHTINRNYR